MIMNKALEAMKNNLLTNKDAVVVLGNDIIKNANLFFATENNQDIYNRKNMIKNPEEFWKFYRQVVAEPDDFIPGSKEQKAVLDFLNLGIVKTVIDSNIDGYIKDNLPDNIEHIETRGDRRELFCTKCGKNFKYDKNSNATLYHNSDKGKLQPSVPFYGAPYPKKLIQDINDSIFDNSTNTPTLKTHALILIGADFSDDLLVEIVDSYNAVRGNENLKYLLIIITDRNPEFIELFHAEFGTSDPIDQSIKRLIALLKE